MSPPGGSAPFPSAMLDHLLVEAAIQCPEADALVGDFGRISYADFLIRAQNIAVVLRRNGVRTGDLVAVATPISPVAITSIAGIILAGAAYVPLTAGLTSLNDLRKVRTGGVSILLCDGANPAQRNLFESWSSLGMLLDASRMEQETMPSSDATHLAPTSPDVPAALFVQADGDPDGVRASHHSIARLVSAGRRVSSLDRLMKFDAGHTFLLSSSDLKHGGIFHLWGSLLHGSALALAPEGLTSRQFADWTLRHGVTVLSLPVPQVAECIDHAPETFSRLRALLIETDGRMSAIAPQRIEWLQQRYPALQIVHAFSTPSVAGYATAYRVPANYKAQAALPIGLPLQGLHAGIFDADQQPVRAGEIGELAFTGVDGCQDAPCFTQERARMRADGMLELHGHAQPHIGAAPDVTIAPQSIATTDTLTRPAQASADLHTPSIPPASASSGHREIEVVSREGAPKEQTLSAERQHEKVLEQVRSLWLRLLHRNTIGYEEDFFEAGGTRIQLIRMHAELNRRFPGAITMHELATLKTIRTIYEHLVHSPGRRSETSLVRRGA